MNRSEAASLARDLMNMHGLGHVPFEFDRGLKRIGATHFKYGIPQKITVSAHWAEHLPKDELQDTILHEIAHAHAGVSAGHGPVWRAHARRIGAKPQRCASPSPEAAASFDAAKPKPWVGTCPAGHTTAAYRAPLRVKACGKCTRVFDVRHVFSWTKNGRKVPMPAKYTTEAVRLEIRHSVSIL
jgi:predicted SprT family Zn-dependent metalloprotease